MTAFWANSGSDWNVEWASPSSFRQMILCDTKETTVERARKSYGAEFGLDSILLGGKRMRWYSASQRLYRNSKILTVMSRGRKDLPGVQIRSEYEKHRSAQLRINLPIQQSLPFRGWR